MGRIKREDIALIIYDFDGVMTDNRVLIFKNGQEAVWVNRSDGLAVKMIKQMGISQVIVSTEANPIVAVRAKKLQIPFVQGVDDKRKVVEEYLHQNRIQKENVVFVGNDINDESAMKFVGIAITPSDGHPDIKKISHVVLSVKGGYGVVREILELLMKAK
jgi:YrbI family 3-deoxy-D-manno-octulosonate 8-phosphate phosphatase